jgi:hypothetical protein
LNHVAAKALKLIGEVYLITVMKAQWGSRGIAQAVPRLRLYVAGHSPRKTGFYPRSLHVGFVVGKVALGQVFPPRVLRFSPVSFIPPVLHYL